MLIINTSRNADQENADLTTHYAPLILREWNNWNTGLSIVNLVPVSNPVTVRYYTMGGELVDTRDLPLPPNGMDFIYTPSAAGDGADPDQGFVGAAIIQATYPVHAVVDEVKYFGEDDDTGHAMSYMTDGRSLQLTDYLLMPMVHRGNPDTGLGSTTGLQLFNPNHTGAAHAKIWFFNADGSLARQAPERITVEPRHGYTAYSLAYNYLPIGFSGSAIVHVTDGRLVAASNNVNYAVQYDGSASMNVFPARWLLDPLDMTLEAVLNPVPHFQHRATVTATLTDRFGEPYRTGGRIVMFETDNLEQTGFDTSPGLTLAQWATNYTDADGKIAFDIVLREEAEINRPIEATVTVKFGDLERQVTVVWAGPPSIEVPDF